MSDTIQANVYADNSFILYLNGELVAEDLIVFVPHKVISVYILAILDQIKSAQGLGGRVRQKFDAERSRKTVCKAISRSRRSIPNWDCIYTNPLISAARSAIALMSSSTGCSE